MKKFINKLKAGLVSFRIALISFPFKVKGLNEGGWRSNPQPMYGVYSELKEIGTAPYYGETVELIENDTSVIESTPTLIDTIIKTVPRLLVAITFIVGIINFIRISKIEDKAEKNKKIKKTVIVIAILVVILVATFVFSTLLLGK